MKKGKKFFQRTLGGFFLAAAILLTQVNIPQVQASTSSDFLMDGTKLIKYAGTANTVSVPTSVKTIGAEAFADCSFLTGVTISKNVETIEYGAFSNCKQLRRVDVPNSVTKIGREAFSNCEQLNRVILGKEVNEIEDGAFAGCTSLKSIEVNKENTYFSSKDGVLYSKDADKIYVMCAGREKNKYNMPSTVKEIDPYAFWKCKNLKSIVFSANMKEIPAYSFSNCSGLESVTIPYSIRQIDMKAFENCSNLIQADIPPSVTYIHLTAFDGCNKLRIEADEGSVAAVFSEQFEKKKEADNKNKNENEIADGESKDNTTEDVPESDASVNTTDVYVENENILGKTVIVSGKAVVLLKQLDQKIYGGETKEREILEETESQPQYENEILERAFYRSSELSEYIISPNVTKIDKFAFARSGLQSIAIPEGTEEIGYAAFYHCDVLNTITIPKSVKKIGAQAFGKTPWMKQWEDTSVDEFLIVGDGVLIAYKGKDAEVIIPEGVKTIAGETFTGKEAITKVTIPESTVTIGDNAFAGCVNLREVSGGSGLKTISGSAFADCPVQVSEISNQNQANGQNMTAGKYEILQKDEGLLARNAGYTFLKWFFMIGFSITGTIILFYKGNRKKLSA